jgi:hypothetical protein
MLPETISATAAASAISHGSARPSLGAPPVSGKVPGVAVSSSAVGDRVSVGVPVEISAVGVGDGVGESVGTGVSVSGKAVGDGVSVGGSLGVGVGGLLGVGVGGSVGVGDGVGVS